jgi:cation:H+ antiporter
MLLDIAAILAGFLLLVWGADRFVTGSAATARNLGVSPLVIGMTIVGFGTSAPEILVATMAALQGNPGLAIGNAIGSNIANVGLILGVTALLAPLTVRSETLRREFPILMAVILFAQILLLDHHLGLLDGLLLISGLVVMLYWMVSLAMRSRVSDPIGAEYDQEIPEHMPPRKAMGLLALGLIVLLVSSRLLVWGATNIAVELGVSDLIIGLTIVAIGTSLPELAASVVSAVKKEHDIAIGNILGSNMYNLLAVLGLPGIINPSIVDDVVLTRDYPVMTVLTLALFAMAYGIKGPGRINRYEGGTLLLAFVIYQSLLYLSATTA